MWLLRDPDIRAISREHPNRNLQSRAGSVNDGYRPIAPLRSANNLRGSAVERVERIEDLDVRALRTQGIVGGGVTTRMSIVSFQPAAYRPTIRAGLQRHPASFCRSAF
jgi:hypothetical protein